MSPPSPPRIRPRRLKQVKSALAIQCQGCEVYRCERRDSGLMARDELLAEMSNLPRPECKEREPDFWERMAS